jgi:predicted ABC-type transport system involved in lysophospholipase L1 biosynthesis ATPase subunit
MDPVLETDVAMLADGVEFLWAANDEERMRAIAEHPDAGLVSAMLPLRANLTVLENIAVVPEFRDGVEPEVARARAWSLLEMVGHTECAHRRDPDLDNRERFLAKLLRAIVGSPPVILIERPGLLLPDFNYPLLLDATLLSLQGQYRQCRIVDYAWNAPLYPRPASRT